MQLTKIIIHWLSRILFGATFVFSGIVKAIDPLGTVYKMEDYFVAMGLEILLPFSYIGAWILFSAEFLCGAIILLGIKPKYGIGLGALFMLVMTPLTLWIALENPVTDCGCFGDALVISNWATFWKNIVLCVLVAALWFTKDVFKEWIRSLTSWLSVAALFLLPCSIASVTMSYLPIIDFRPYHIGADIQEQMTIPEDAKLDVYKTIFIFLKDGVEKEIDETQLASIDSTWAFVDQKTELIEKGYVPPIHDFSIVTIDGEDITDIVLEDDGRTYLCAMYDLKLADAELGQDIDEVYKLAQSEGARFIALTASDDVEIADWIDKTGAEYDFAITDPIQLKTMVRANPGIVVIEKGIVVDKWNVQTQNLK